MLVVADQRITAGVPATLRWDYLDGDGVPVVDPETVTVEVVHSDGTEIKAEGTATTALTGADAGTYTVALVPAETANLGTLTATWSVDGAGTFTTTIEIVGRHYLTIPEILSFQPSLTGRSNADLIVARTAAENEVEFICDRSFVARAGSAVLDGNADTTLWLPDNDVTAVTAVTADGTAWTEVQLAAIYQYGRAIELVDNTWPEGRGNLTIAYQWGLTTPPPDLKIAMAVRVQELANGSASGVLARARTYNPESGGSYELDRADRWRTGNPDVDAVYQRWSLRPVSDNDSGSRNDGSVPAPASRSLDMNPQWGSLFHGGRQ